MSIVDLSYSRLALSYVLLLIPLAVMILCKVKLINRTLIAVGRMTAQLLLVGFYLGIIFEQRSPLLTLMWVLVMLIVSSITTIHSSDLKLKNFIFPLFSAIAIGTSLPLLFFTGILIAANSLFEPRYLIPIGGMIMGNCMNANIIAIKTLYHGLRDREEEYLYRLTQGATKNEALEPFIRKALESALMPTIASITTIGLVALPGMMTGTILGGASPAVAIKYQIAIMLSIFCGTSLTVYLAMKITEKTAFDDYGILIKSIFPIHKKK